MAQEVENLREQSSKVDDSGSPKQTFWNYLDENIFCKTRTHLRVQFGPFKVHMVQEVENLRGKSSKVDDSR